MITKTHFQEMQLPEITIDLMQLPVAALQWISLILRTENAPNRANSGMPRVYIPVIFLYTVHYQVGNL